MPAPQTDIDLLTPADAARILGLSVDMVRVLATTGQLATAVKTTRGGRLFRREDVEELAATREGRTVRHHSVQFYETDAHLAAVVGGFVGDGLRGGGPAIVIATEAHGRAFLEALGRQDLGVGDAVASGRLRLLDADETLARFLRDGMPDDELFRQHVGALVEELRKEWPRGRLRVYGEMVAGLWEQGRREAAIELEHCWNRFAALQPFALLCAYPLAGFSSGDDAAAFDTICDLHTRVVPTESFRQQGGIDARHREIARLQQRARALEMEIGDRSRVEEDLRRAKRDLVKYNDELGEALRAKDEILAMLGHELRNPLAPILSAVELMRMRGRESREHAIIERQVRALHRLVEDLLDIGRLAHGKVELQRRPMELAEVVRRACERAGDALDARRDDLRIDVAPTGLSCSVDPDRMAQAVENVLRNAAQNSAPGSRIAVSAAKRDGNIVLSVRDTGVGIAPDLLPRVFDLFVQHPQPIDRSRGGLGTGLAITKNIVELHGGRVTAHSEGPGRGSELVVELPAPRGAAAPGAAKKLAARRVLVVDDNHEAAEMLGELLVELGHVAEVAHDAEAALEVARRFDPELALLDIGLPVVDGYELARRLRTERPALRLVAVSGYGDASNKARSAAAGFEAHLVKPITIEAVLALLEVP
jgi:signal transduction histidine kinase/CheY-like chemotaxis protein